MRRQLGRRIYFGVANHDRTGVLRDAISQFSSAVQSGTGRANALAFDNMNASDFHIVKNTAWDAATEPRISVVFPTFCRPDTLPLVFAALAAQTDMTFEVVVCDDASGDTTAALLREAIATAAFPLACLTLAAHGGPARARNRALTVARAPVVLLLGDDILPPSDLVARHVAWHAAHPDERDALLGSSTWDESLPPNALMRWLEHGGRRFAFNYYDLPPHRLVSGHFFYTCHVSLKLALLMRTGGFDESFPFASHEDLELGLRLEQYGMQLRFEPTLVVRHRHMLDLAAVTRRVYRMGSSSVAFWQRVPGGLPRGRAAARTVIMRFFTWPVARRLATLRCGVERPQVVRWTLLLSANYWCGAADAARGRSPMA